MAVVTAQHRCVSGKLCNRMLACICVIFLVVQQLYKYLSDFNAALTELSCVCLNASVVVCVGVLY